MSRHALIRTEQAGRPLPSSSTKLKDRREASAKVLEIDKCQIGLREMFWRDKKSKPFPPPNCFHAPPRAQQSHTILSTQLHQLPKQQDHPLSEYGHKSKAICQKTKYAFHSNLGSQTARIHVLHIVGTASTPKHSSHTKKHVYLSSLSKFERKAKSSSESIESPRQKVE